MKKLLLLSFALLIIITGCSKKDDPVAPTPAYTVKFEITSAPIDNTKNYLQIADTVTYSAFDSDGIEIKANLPWTYTADNVPPVVAALTVTYDDIFNIVTHPTGTEDAANTTVTLRIYKDDAVLETGTLTNITPENATLTIQAQL